MLLKHIKSLFNLAAPSQKVRQQVPTSELDGLLASGRASNVRAALKDAVSQNANYPLAALLDRVKVLGWDEFEREKLAAYGEFFTGQAAAAFQRVIARGLARDDYQLFMTSCVHCYLYDKFAEGRELLKQFDNASASDFNQDEFLPFAGYIAFAGGGAIEEATGYLDQALDRQCITPLLTVNAYPIYFEAGLHERTEQIRRLIVERYPDDPEAIYALACGDLARDYYPEGFRLAEARYRMPEVSRSINPSLLAKPRWQGEPLQGKRLLVHGEQGYGDIIMMARYLPKLRALGAEVVIDCREAAISLLEYNYPDCEVIAGNLKKPINTGFDCWTGIMSLPFHFDTTAASVPATSGYLRVPAEQKDYWRRRVSQTGRSGTPKIGIAWSGNPSHRADGRRSMRFDTVVRHLAAYRQADFYCLQTSVPPVTPKNLIDTSEEMVTLADTAALIAEMDLVITVDTSIVHIAGAMGIETWLLLPYRYEWRWGLVGEKNNWYDSVRVLRQKAHGDWNGLLRETFETHLPEVLRQLARP